MNIFKKIGLGIHLTLTRLGIGMANAEEEIFAPKDLNELNEKNKHMIKAEVRNKFARMMQQGQRDEQFVKDYYELLKKADEFMEKATPEKIAQVQIDRNLSVGLKFGANGKPVPYQRDEEGNVLLDENNIPMQKDSEGRRYDHYGFFDPKHKHYGKTMREVTLDQVEERRLKDDDFPIEYMINNTPIVEGMSKAFDFATLPTPEQAKHFKFPIRVTREKETNNKIEQLTEFLHVKRIDGTHRILEFIIPKKFGLARYEGDTKIMNELCDIQQVWNKEKYGEHYGFAITKFYKFIETDKHDVIKFKAKLIEKVK